jgi:hypothetical protein
VHWLWLAPVAVALAGSGAVVVLAGQLAREIELLRGAVVELAEVRPAAVQLRQQLDQAAIRAKGLGPKTAGS